MTQEAELEIVDNLVETPEDDLKEILPFKYSITSYGADFPVDALVKRTVNESIFVPPFQRSFVWSLTKASRFIESLLLGLPVPGIFLSKEQKTEKMLVIDGQQRLLTLKYFYDGIFSDTKREFALKGVESRFNGSTYRSLKSDDQLRLDNSIVHATIVKQDEPSDDDSSIYHIFERINTGGLLLAPQEIRGCIYHGSFNDTMHKLNENKSWRSVYGEVSRRMRDRELILRFLALYFDGSNYAKPMKEFLNNFMGKNRSLEFYSEKQLSNTFEQAIEIIYKVIGNKAFKPVKNLNAAVFDAVMVGVAQRLGRGKIRDTSALSQQYETLVSNEVFLTACETATADDVNVKNRLQLAKDAFKDIT